MSLLILLGAAASVPGSADLTGVEATGAAGTANATGNKITTMQSWLSIGGTPSREQYSHVYGTPGSADLTGVEGTGAADAITVTGDANVDVTGAEGTGAAGDLVVGIAEFLTGVESASAGGDVTVTGDANVDVTGVEGTGAAGDATIFLPKVSTMSSWLSVAATPWREQFSRGTDVSVSLTGVAGTGEANTVTIENDEQAALTGAAGTGAAGDLTTTSAVSVTLTGASGTMAVQGIEARNSSSTPVEGVAATGAAAEPTPIFGAGEVAYLDSVETIGASGTVDGQLGIPGGVYFLGARSPTRIGTMTTAVSYRPRIQITAVSPQRRVIVCYFDDRRIAA